MESKILEVIDNQRIRLTEIAMKVQEIVTAEIRRLDEFKISLMKTDNNRPKVTIDVTEPIDQDIILNGRKHA